MSYEYDGFGAGVTSYGTLPEAQEYVAEEFGLPWPVPAATVLPAPSPRKPRTAISIFRPEDALGVEDVCEGPGCWLERHKPLVWAGGIAAGIVGMRWLLKRREQRMLENPSPRDIKLAETGRDGSIPMRRGKYKPLDPDSFDDPRRIGVNKFVEACFQLRPDLRERLGNLKRPVAPKRSPDARTRGMARRGRGRITRIVPTQDQMGLHVKWRKERQDWFEVQLPKYFRRRFELLLLKSGRERFTVKDWVGNKFFDRFRAFTMPCFSPRDYRVGMYSGARAKKTPLQIDRHRIDTAMTLWLSLGMPHGATLTARAADTVCRVLRLSWRRQDAMQLFLVSARTVYDASEAVIWQLISIPGIIHLSSDDKKTLINSLKETVGAESSHRVRWWTERHIASALFEAGDHSAYLESLEGEGLGQFRRYRSRYGESRKQIRHEKFLEFRRLADFAPKHRGAKIRLPWRDMPDAMQMSERDFVAEYAPSSGDAYAWLYNRMPQKRAVRALTPSTVAVLSMKELLRTQRSSEIQGMLDEAIQETKEEDRDYAAHLITTDLESIQWKDQQLKVLNAEIKQHRDGIKKRSYTSRERGKWLSKLNRMVALRKRRQYGLRRAKASLKRSRKLLKTPMSERMLRSIEKDVQPDMQQAAIGLAVVFGPNWRSWIKKMKRRGINIHDATHWLPRKTSPGLGDYLLERWQANTDDLRAIVKGWNTLGDNDKRLPPKEIRAILLSRAYAKATIPKLAMEAAKWGVPEGDYYRIERSWKEALEQRSERPSTIPDLEIRRDGYHLFKMAPDDPRGLFLGEHSDCCQHPLGVGASCAWHGVYSPDGAFYVVTDAAEEIVAQAWTWRHGGDIVFDSLEGYAVRDEREAIINGMFVELAGKIVASEAATRVLTGSFLSPLYSTTVLKALLPTDYPRGGYSDARYQQSVLATSAEVSKEQA